MADNFKDYYNYELAYLRHMGEDFGKRNGDVARRLRLEIDHCDDPHVERLLEGFAFLAARIHKRLDDEFPEITGALLEELYPDLTRPVPPVAIVQLEMDPERGDLTQQKKVNRGTTFTTELRDGTKIKFQTCYGTEIWPLQVAKAEECPGPRVPPELANGRKTSTAIEIELSSLGGLAVSALDLDRLRLYLTGSPSLVNSLYQLLLSRCHTIAVCGEGAAGRREIVPLNPSCLQAVGFDVEREGLCPNPAMQGAERGVAPQFAGFRILEDYFIFPWKFHFLDLAGLEGVTSKLAGDRLSVWFLLSPIDDSRQQKALGEINQSTFRLGCTPAVNLFSAKSGPVPVRTHRYEELIPVEEGTEIYSVDGVAGGGKTFNRLIGGSPLAPEAQPEGYFTVSRRDNRADGRPPEYFLSLVRRRGKLQDLGVRAVTATLTCTNRERLAAAVVGAGIGVFTMRGSPEVKIRCIQGPTPGLVAPARRNYLWRLLSQLSLNHLSLVEDGLEALQSLLRIHNLTGAGDGDGYIEGIKRVHSSPGFERVNWEHGTAFVRGKKVEITLDESRFSLGGMFLFGSVLDRFLGLYTSLNSFSQLTVKVGSRQFHSWPARSGSKIVI